jgi:hypothetical protein
MVQEWEEADSVVVICMEASAAEQATVDGGTATDTSIMGHMLITLEDVEAMLGVVAAMVAMAAAATAVAGTGHMTTTGETVAVVVAAGGAVHGSSGGDGVGSSNWSGYGYRGRGGYGGWR